MSTSTSAADNDPTDEESLIANARRDVMTSYGTGDLYSGSESALSADDSSSDAQQHQYHHRGHRRDSSKLSTITTTTMSSTSQSTTSTTGLGTRPILMGGNKRLILVVPLIVCSYIGFYAVFVLWSHHNHPDGVFGEATANKNKQKYDSNNNLSDRAPTKFLFGNIGSILMGGTSNKQTVRPNPNPVPRSILLMLHAEEVPGNDAVMLDEDRPLTATGMQQSERLGSYLADHHIAPPDWIFCSPSVRTSYTLELVRRHWASNVPVAFEKILYILAFNDYFAFVAGLNPNFRRVLIVGHNPAILNTAKKLMRVHGIEDFPDAGFLELTWDDQQVWHTIFPGTGEVTTAVSGGGPSDFFDATTLPSS